MPGFKILAHGSSPTWPIGPEPFQAKLVRWHQQSYQKLGADLAPLLAACPSLTSLDLFHFYCWTEDLIPALKDHPAATASLEHLNLLSASSAEGFHASELTAITVACPNLRHFFAPCVFNPHYVDFIDDASLLALAAACPHLSLLHLINPSTLSLARPVLDPANDILARNDSGITAARLESLFTAPPPPSPSHASTSSPPPPPMVSTPSSSPPLAPTSATSSPPVSSTPATLTSSATPPSSPSPPPAPTSPPSAPSLTLPITSLPVTSSESLPLGSKASSLLSPTSRTSPSITTTMSGMPARHGPWRAWPIPKRTVGMLEADLE